MLSLGPWWRHHWWRPSSSLVLWIFCTSPCPILSHLLPRGKRTEGKRDLVPWTYLPISGYSTLNMYLQCILCISFIQQGFGSRECYKTTPWCKSEFAKRERLGKLPSVLCFRSKLQCCGHTGSRKDRHLTFTAKRSPERALWYLCTWQHSTGFSSKSIS